MALRFWPIFIANLGALATLPKVLVSSESKQFKGPLLRPVFLVHLTGSDWRSPRLLLRAEQVLSTEAESFARACL